MEKFVLSDRDFFEREPDIVAKELLGKILVRTINKKRISGIIVETESYFGEDDPASRAYKRKSERFYNKMISTPGHLLVYMVHNNYLLNIISHKKGKAGAVLIRAVEPVEGIEEMIKGRGKPQERDLTSGPGKLTKSFYIDKNFDGYDIIEGKEIFIEDRTNLKFDIESSRRIGVKRDLEENYRFYIKNNPFVSKISKNIF